MHFPTCFACIDYNSLDLDAQEQVGGEQILSFIGTKEGNLLTYKISAAGSQKLAETRAGISYGAISALDVSINVEKLVGATESGEIFTAKIISYIEYV